MMRVHQRCETGTGLHTEDVPFYPFFFLTDIHLLHGFPRDKFRCKTLRGSNAYRYLVVFTTWQTHWDAISHIAKVTGTKDDTPEQLYLIPNPAQQYLLQTGRTLFKDMTFDEVYRLQLDIEVYTAGTFPHAQRPEDRIMHVTSFRDPLKEMDKLHGLYDALAEARREIGEEAVPFHKFADLVKSQVNKLTSEGHTEVAFRVAVKDGKVNFTVRATNDGSE